MRVERHGVFSRRFRARNLFRYSKTGPDVFRPAVQNTLKWLCFDGFAGSDDGEKVPNDAVQTF